MIVNKIQRDKKHLTKVTFDNGKEIFIDNDVLAENGLTSGTFLTEEEVEEMRAIIKRENEQKENGEV
jgi:hypothetical protein